MKQTKSTNTGTSSLIFCEGMLLIGSYVIRPLDTTHVSILDTRTGEGGSFAKDALITHMDEAMDAFFVKHF